MDFSAMKKWLHRFIAMDSDKDGFIKLKDFARFLRVPNDACLQAVFNSADKVNCSFYTSYTIANFKTEYQQFNYFILCMCYRPVMVSLASGGTSTMWWARQCCCCRTLVSYAPCSM